MVKTSCLVTDDCYSKYCRAALLHSVENIAATAVCDLSNERGAVLIVALILGN